jgi:hypothetical protein
MNFRSIATTSVLTALLCSCASTSVKHTWKSPEYHDGPQTKLAVLTIEERGMLRQAFESRFAIQLRKQGASVVTTFDQLSLPEINRDKPAAAERLRSAGAEGLVMLRLMDISASYDVTRPGPERWAPYVTGIESGYWYDYYSVAFADMSPTYGNLKQKVFLETSLFDLKTGKRVWSGLTQTVFTDTMDRVAEMDKIVGKVVAAMRQDAMVP